MDGREGPKVIGWAPSWAGFQVMGRGFVSSWERWGGAPGLAAEFRVHTPVVSQFDTRKLEKAIRKG